MPLVPFPSGGISFTKVEMPIEQAAGAGAGTRTTHEDPAPAGSTWSQCP
jgi:hypothetical protein